MRLIYKTILHKKWSSILLLTLLSFIVLLSSQITVTLYSKNMSLAQRIDQVNGSHLHVYQTIAGEYFNVESVLDENVSAETTYAFKYNNGMFDNDIFFEGYVSSDTNRFEVIQGKPLNELQGYEIAITESYARSLKKLGIEPIDYKITMQGNDGTTHEFVVVSIVDYPNFNDGYMGVDRLKNIKLFNYPLVSVALGNYNTIKQLAMENKAEIGSRLVHKIRFHDYSSAKEQDFIKRLGDKLDVYGRYEVNIAPLFEITQLRSTSDILFQFLSIFVLSGLMIGSLYTFYLFLREQLMQDAQNIGTMVLQGIARKRLQLAYSIELLLVVMISFALFILMNLGLSNLVKQNRSFAMVLDTNSIILIRTLLIYLAYVSILTILFMGQLRRYMNHALLMKNTQDYLYIKQKNVNSVWYVSQLAMKNIIANWRHSIGSIISSSVILITIAVMISANYSVSHIYGADTLGVKFDYIVGTVPFEVYHEAKQFSDDTVWLNKLSNFYFLDVDYSENIRTYYKSNYLIFNNRMQGFVDPAIGNPVNFPSDLFYHENRDYFRFTVASRRHMDHRDLKLYGATSTNIEKQFLFYLSKNYPNDRETAAPIHAFVNTLIDNGWIAYDVRFETEKPDDNIGKYVQMFLVNVKDENQAKQLEQFLIDKQANYLSHEKVITILNEWNKDVNERVFLMLSIVSTILIFLLIIMMITNIRCHQIEQQHNNVFLQRIGIKKGTIQRRMIVQELVILLNATLLSALLLPVIQPAINEGLLKAYGLYSMPVMPNIIYIYFALIPLTIFVIIVLLRKPVKI